MSFNLVIKGQVNSDSLVSISLDSIIVNATRFSIPLINAPFSISSHDNLNSKSQYSLKELLQGTSGLSINSRYNFSQGDKILLRGIGTRSTFGVRGIKMFLDGIPLTFPDGQSQLNNLDLQNVDKVEIVKGPSSTLYGNSLGGVIYFKSKFGDNTKPYVKSDLSIGSFGYQKYNLSSGGSILNGDYSIGGYYTKSNGFREHSDSKFYGVNINLKFELYKDFFLSLVSNYHNAPYLLNPSSLNSNDAENNPEIVRSSIKRFASGKKITQFQNGLSLLYLLNARSKLTTTFYGVTRSLKNSIPGRIIELERLFVGARVEFENKFNLLSKDVFTLVGVDYESQVDNRKEFENGGIENPGNITPNQLFKDIIYNDKLIQQSEKVKSLGTFFHVNINLTNKLILFAGFRYDDYLFEVEEKLINKIISEIKMNNFSNMFGFSYKLKNNITLFGNYSTGFQTPTTNELSNNPLREGGFNTSLNPELINNYELGLRGWWNSPLVYSNISFYKMDISDMLISYQSEEEETFYRNAGSAINFGVEFDVEFQLLKNLYLSSNYSYLNFEFDDYLVENINNGTKKEFQLSGNSLPGVPKNKFLISTQYKLPLCITFAFSYSWTDKYYANDFNGPLDLAEDASDYINDSYSLFNFSLLYSAKIDFADINFKLYIENLFDIRYNDSIVPNAFGNNFFEPAAGRNFNFSVSASF